MSKKAKEAALKIVIRSMEEVKNNFEISAVKDDVVAYAEAMKILADAFAKIAESK